MLTSTTTRNQTDSDLQTTLETAHARAAKLETEARAERLDLERALRLARGTRDVAPKVVAEVKLAPAKTLAARLEDLLRGPGAPVSLVDLVAATGESAGKVSAELRRMRATKCPTRSLEDAADARLVHNHGTEFEPRWGWVVGDQTETSELSNAVEKMITVRPYTFAELTLATGARRGRLSGVLVRFQREGREITNEGGSDRQYRWSMRPKKRAGRTTK